LVDAVGRAREIGLAQLVEAELVEAIKIRGDLAARGMVEAGAQLAEDADRAAEGGPTSGERAVLLSERPMRLCSRLLDGAVVEQLDELLGDAVRTALR
jgi:hypothetical protein